MEALNANIAARLAEAAQRHPERLALVEWRRGRRRALTYGDLAREVAARARVFRERGLAPMDRVLLLVPMSIDLYLVLLALMHVGGAAVFVDAWAGWKRVDEAVRRTTPRFFVGSLRAQMLRLWSPAVRAIPSKILAPMRAPAVSTDIAPEQLEALSPALITFTTGTTAGPKASLRTHGFLWDQHVVLSKYLGPAEGEIDMPTLPIFILHNLAAGATSVLPDFDPRRPAEIDPSRIREQMAVERVTSVTASPAFFDRLLEPSQGKLQLRRAFTGGAPVSPTLARRLDEGIEGDAYVVYGSTEAEPISLILARDLVAASASRGHEGICVGSPVSELGVRLVEPLTGESQRKMIDCAPGEAGEITVSGKHVQTAYFDANEAARLPMDPDLLWHRTGDGGRIDEHGRLWLLGRVSARVSAGGRIWWSLPAELAAMELAGVRHAAYLGDPARGAILCLEGTGLAASRLLFEQARSRLAPYPVDEIHVLGKIPRDPRHASKTDLRALRRRLGIPDHSPTAP